MSARVTVLLAVHNGEPYVGQAVQSTLDQTFSDFELLVVDDASTDGTVALLEAIDDERIRILRNERNLGQVASLNRGLREARGEYVARIDHDDWSRPARLERQVAVLDAEPEVGLVGTWMELVDLDGRPVATLDATIDDFVEFLFHTLIMRVYVAHPASMYRREPVVALGGYDEATGPAEDKDLWRKLALERWDARIVPEPLVVYRVHEGQLSQTQAAYQHAVDGRSQERFLAALCPDAPVRTLRVLLANDPAFWAEGAAPLDGLERLLAASATALRLAEAEAGQLERLVAGQLLVVARTRPWRSEARALAAWALARLSPEERRRAVRANAAAFAVAPLRLAARGVGQELARRALPDAIRGRARGSRVARRLYAKLVGGGR
jgi:GT2 family glycosyltransferase